MDVIYLAIIAVFAAATVGLVRLCGSLGGEK
jgi:hypothetical protein